MTWLQDDLSLTQEDKNKLTKHAQEIQNVADAAVDEGGSPSEAIIKKCKEILSEN